MVAGSMRIVALETRSYGVERRKDWAGRIGAAYVVGLPDGLPALGIAGSIRWTG